jgi:hypothetical protein
MTRRLSVVWPDAHPFAGREGPIRLLAVSDAVDPALDHQVNRDQIGRLDAIVGCGDLEPGYLGFLGDAFGVPVSYVRGNHDRGGHWAESQSSPAHLTSGRVVDVDGVTVVPFEWPGLKADQALRDERSAWMDVARAARTLGVRRFTGRKASVLVVSHAPPLGVGDCSADPYHVGYRAYRWFLERVRPPLWLHGHTTPASVSDWRAGMGDSAVINVTGSVIVELLAPGSPPSGHDSAPH